MKENKNGRFDASEVAAYIVQKMNEEEGYLDHLKLQKLLYFITLQWVKEYNEYPYKQATEMWKLGPVVRSVYSEYRSNGYGQIFEPSSHLSFEDDCLIFSKRKPASFSTEEKDLVDRVIEKYGKMNSFELVDITHEHEPWKDNEKVINSMIKSEIEYTFEDLKITSEKYIN